MTTDPGPMVEELLLDQIATNPLNPRKHIDAEELARLTESVRVHGILQPIVVRPHPKRLKRTPYQLVVGERRLRAAQACELGAIPAQLRDVDDTLCLEIMLIENGRRTDLDPVEEAETYHRLQKDFGLKLEEVAARVGKSTTAVFQRVKLMACNADVRKALAEGNLSVSVAELIGRAVHPSQQADALHRLAANRWEGAPSYREAKRIVYEEFMLRLAGVPWKLDDAKLDPKAGACLVCPKRTGNQRELFADTKAKDVCLDRECFERKRKMAREERLAAAAADGSAILEGEDAAKVFDRHGQVKRSSGYVDLGRATGDVMSSGLGKRTKSIGQILGKRHRPPVTVVEVPGTDRVIELARARDVEKAMDAKGIKPKKGETPPAGPSRETLERHKTRAQSAVYDAQIAAVVEHCEAQRDPLVLSVRLVRAIARELYAATWQDAAEATRKRRGFPSSPVLDDRPILNTIEKGTAGEVLGLALELLAQAHRPKSYRDANMDFLNAVAPLYTVDLKTRAAGVRDYLRKLARQRSAKKGSKRSKSSTTKGH